MRLACASARGACHKNKCSCCDVGVESSDVVFDACGMENEKTCSFEAKGQEFCVSGCCAGKKFRNCGFMSSITKHGGRQSRR